MDKQTRFMLAVSSIVIAVLTGINIMTDTERSGHWLLVTLIFAGLAFMFWWWMGAEERRARAEADRLARERIRQAEEELRRARETAPVLEAPVAVETPAPAVEPEPEPVVVEPEPEPVVVEPEPEPVAVAESPEPDDLTKIEGIGPYYRDLLHGAGITTFAALAKLSKDEIDALIQQAGGRRSNTTGTWAEQAALAATGRWDDLAALQSTLSAGRRKG